jgi:hypothetical protein
MVPQQSPNPSTEAGLGLRKESRTRADRTVGSPRKRVRGHRVASCGMNLTTAQSALSITQMICLIRFTSTFIRILALPGCVALRKSSRRRLFLLVPAG